MKKLILIVLMLAGITSYAQVNRPYVDADKVTLDQASFEDSDGSFKWDGTDMYIYDGSSWVAIGGGSSSSPWTQAGGEVYITTSANILKVGSDADNVNGKINFEASDGDDGTIIITTSDVLQFDNFATISMDDAMKVEIGKGNTAVGSVSICLGEGHRTDGERSIAMGLFAHTWESGQISFSNTRFTVGDFGDAQTSHFNMNTDTTHSAATWFPLYLDGASTLLNINAESKWKFIIELEGMTDNGAKTWDYQFRGSLKRDASNNTTLVWSTKTVEYEDDADFDARVTADDTNEALLIEVQDATSGGDKVRWVATLWITQTIF